MNRATWRLFIQILLYRPYRKLGIIFLSLIITLIGLSSPVFQKLFLDQLLQRQFEPRLLVLASLSLLIGFVGYQVIVILSTRLAVETQKELGLRLYAHLLKVQASHLNEKTIGSLVSTYATDIPSSTILIEQSLPQGLNIFFPLLLAPFALTLFFDVSWLHLMPPLLGFILINLFLAFRQSMFFARFKELAAVRIGYVTEWIQNIRNARMLGWLNYFELQILKARINETKNRLKMLNNGQTMNTISSTMTFIMTGYLLYHHPNPTPSNILGVFWIVSIYFSRPFRQFPWFLTFIFDAWTSTKRLAEILALPTVDRNQHPHPTPAQRDNTGLTLGPPSIQVKNLNLILKNRHILKEISFAIQPGEFFGIIGPIGSGKTLLLLSLLGETEASFDEYYIGNVNMLTLPKTEWKKFFSYSCQESFLISSTLRDNMSLNYNHPPFQDAILIENLKQAHFQPEAEGMELGLNTVVGERGFNFSGGQKQRIQLARSLIKSSPIYLFDDCLSALDVTTEHQIVEQLLLKKLSRSTRILVTHRRSTLERMDRVLVLDEGKVKAVGQIHQLNLDWDEFDQWQDQQI